VQRAFNLSEVYIMGYHVIKAVTGEQTLHFFPERVLDEEPGHTDRSMPLGSFECGKRDEFLDQRVSDRSSFGEGYIEWYNGRARGHLIPFSAPAGWPYHMRADPRRNGALYPY